jgi:hypothetical protein
MANPVLSYKVCIDQVKLTRKATHTQDYPAWVSKMCLEDVCLPLTDTCNYNKVNTMFAKRLNKHFPHKWKDAKVSLFNKVQFPYQNKDFICYGIVKSWQNSYP